MPPLLGQNVLVIVERYNVDGQVRHTCKILVIVKRWVFNCGEVAISRGLTACTYMYVFLFLLCAFQEQN
jgi:hypothetical protein